MVLSFLIQASHIIETDHNNFFFDGLRFFSQVFVKETEEMGTSDRERINNKQLVYDRMENTNSNLRDKLIVYIIIIACFF